MFFVCYRLPRSTFSWRCGEADIGEVDCQAFVVRSRCAQLGRTAVDIAVQAAEEEATAVHEAAACRAGARLRLQHVYHQADPLGTVAAPRSHRATGQDLVSEPAHEGQEADAETRSTPPLQRRRRPPPGNPTMTSHLSQNPTIWKGH